MKRKLTLLAFIAFVVFTMKAQTSPKEITDKFFSLYATDPIKAVDYAFSTNKWFDRQQDAVENLKTKLKDLVGLCGNYCGFEVLSQKVSGASMVAQTFIVRYEREPVRFTFVFYKPKETWMVDKFAFDEGLGRELEDAVKQSGTKDKQ